MARENFGTDAPVFEAWLIIRASFEDDAEHRTLLTDHAFGKTKLTTAEVLPGELGFWVSAATTTTG